MGYGCGRGGGKGRLGKGYGRGWGHGAERPDMGRKNPYPYCHWNPNLPRGWWRFPPDYWEKLGWEVSSWPTYKAGKFPITSFPGHTPDIEKQHLEVEISAVKNELTALESRLRQLSTEKKIAQGDETDD